MYYVIMVRTQINLRENQYQAIQEKARREGESLSEVVRDIIDSTLKTKKQESNAWVLLEMAKHAVSTGRDRNLSTTYKKILYGGKK